MARLLIRAYFDDKGLTVSAKSRAVAAFDRLIGGVVGIAAEYFEGVRKRAELRGVAREQFIQAESLRTASLSSSLNDFSQISTQRSVAEETRKQLNREGVWIEATKAFQDAHEPASSSPEHSFEEVEEDWINVFATFAERASSERLQQLWGRILSGEIHKPRSFAISTLRVISEMDAEIATAFQEVVALRLQGGFVTMPEKFESEELIKWTLLEEVGLLQEVNGSLGYSTTTTSEDYTPPTYETPLRLIYAQTKEFGLLLTHVRQFPNSPVLVVKITRTGQQIANILPWNELGALRAIAAVMREDVGMDIVKLKVDGADVVAGEWVENIKPVPPQPGALAGVGQGSPP